MTELPESEQWFRQRMGARIDALEIGLQALLAGEPNSRSSMRRMAQALAEQAQGYRLGPIESAARRVEQSTDPDLPESLRALIAVLRDEAAHAAAAPACVLLVGGKPDFNRDLTAQITAPHRTVLATPSAADAMKALQDHEVSLMVLSLCLPDEDGRSFLQRVRSDSRLAALPVLLLAPKFSATLKADDTLCEAGGFMEEPFDAAQIAAWIKARLRRASGTIKSARRDRPTGLLNRNGLREAYEKAVKECDAAREPLALALIAVQVPAPPGTPLNEQQEEAVQRVGSVLSGTLRATDIIGRWAASHFMVLLPGEDVYGACRAVDKVLAASQRARPSDGPAPVLSAGVTVAAAGAKMEDAVGEAERHLYQAAAAGGGRVVSHRSPGAAIHHDRVLLLIGDEVTGRILKRLFENEGAEVELLPSLGASLPDAICEQRFRLVLIDEKLPEAGGIAGLELFRKSSRYNRVPIVLLTAGPGEEAVARALAAGATDYVTRPLSPAAFMVRMRRLMSRGLTPEPAAAGRDRKLLVIDDDVRQLLMAASALQLRGAFRVFLAKGEDDACRRFEEASPQALIVSLDMADFQLGPFLARLGKQADVRSLSLILASEQKQTPAPDSLPAAVRGVVTKPYSPLTLGEQIEKLLGATPPATAPAELRQHLNSEIHRLLKSGGI